MFGAKQLYGRCPQPIHLMPDDTAHYVTYIGLVKAKVDPSGDCAFDIRIVYVLQDRQCYRWHAPLVRDCRSQYLEGKSCMRTRGK